MQQLATITVIGKDKTGVIARVTNFLFHSKANIEALEEQVTRGQFSMTLQASWRSNLMDCKTVQAQLHELGRSLKMEIRVRFRKPTSRQRFAIFCTREPLCPSAILKKFGHQHKTAEPAVMIANRRDLAPLAEQAGIPFRHLAWTDRESSEVEALQILEQLDVDFVVLARFMKILSPNFVWRFKNKIINIHPSLLPSFPGPQAYRQAYENGVKIAGVTAHFVTMHLDEGPIIAQSAFPILPRMGLKEIVAKGQKMEAKTLVKAIDLYLSRRLDVHWGVVKNV